MNMFFHFRERVTMSSMMYDDLPDWQIAVLRRDMDFPSACLVCIGRTPDAVSECGHATCVNCILSGFKGKCMYCRCTCSRKAIFLLPVSLATIPEPAEERIDVKRYPLPTESLGGVRGFRRDRAGVENVLRNHLRQIHGGGENQYELVEEELRKIFHRNPCPNAQEHPHFGFLNIAMYTPLTMSKDYPSIKASLRYMIGTNAFNNGVEAYTELTMKPCFERTLYEDRIVNVFLANLLNPFERFELEKRAEQVFRNYFRFVDTKARPVNLDDSDGLEEGEIADDDEDVDRDGSGADGDANDGSATDASADSSASSDDDGGSDDEADDEADDEIDGEPGDENAVVGGGEIDREENVVDGIVDDDGADNVGAEVFVARVGQDQDETTVGDVAGETDDDDDQTEVNNSGGEAVDGVVVFAETTVRIESDFVDAAGVKAGFIAGIKVGVRAGIRAGFRVGSNPSWRTSIIDSFIPGVSITTEAGTADGLDVGMVAGSSATVAAGVNMTGDQCASGTSEVVDGLTGNTVDGSSASGAADTSGSSVAVDRLADNTVDGSSDASSTADRLTDSVVDGSSASGSSGAEHGSTGGMVDGGVVAGRRRAYISSSSIIQHKKRRGHHAERQ
ncbi:serine-aspartate repeat-containing protein I-like isoform X2 [Cloeon dipterum]|uniref:serine-aspartate repeat-containing protein I-like isoform X2 n=1 Tax=Cloeon dipterum TaxID=197152 RepID=UPI003220793E